MSTGEIASNLGLTTGSVTSLVDSLEKIGYVARKPNPDDRRSILVAAIPSVHKVLGERYRGAAKSILELFAGDSVANLKISIDALSRLRRACQTQLDTL